MLMYEYISANEYGMSNNNNCQIIKLFQQQTCAHMRNNPLTTPFDMPPTLEAGIDWALTDSYLST